MLCETTISKECWIERRTVRYDRVNCELVIGPGLLQLAGRGGENWAIFNLPLLLVLRIFKNVLLVVFIGNCHY